MNEEKMVCLSHKHAYTYYNKVMCFVKLVLFFQFVVETKANIHTKDDNIGMNAQFSLPWKLQIINDLTMFPHCGSQQHETNTNNWVWNAQMIYSFSKRKLMAKL